MSTPDIRAAQEEAEQHATAEVWADHPLARQPVSTPYKLPAPVAPTDEELFESAVKALGYKSIPSDGSCMVAEPCELLDFARTVLARWGRPTPPAPEPGEVATIAARLNELAHAVTEERWREFSMRIFAEPLRDANLVMSRAATLLQQLSAPSPAVVPVAVSERLPDSRPESEGGDCDAEGRCWVLMPATPFPNWSLLWKGHLQPYHSHWLPASAIPAPSNYIRDKKSRSLHQAGEGEG